MTYAKSRQKKQKQKQKKERKTGARVHDFSSLLNIFRVLRKIILRKPLLRKIGKKRVKNSDGGRDSKECACPTCTPCEGAAPPSTPQRRRAVFKGGRHV